MVMWKNFNKVITSMLIGTGTIMIILIAIISYCMHLRNQEMLKRRIVISRRRIPGLTMRRPVPISTTDTQTYFSYGKDDIDLYTKPLLLNELIAPVPKMYPSQSTSSFGQSIVAPRREEITPPPAEEAPPPPAKETPPPPARETPPPLVVETPPPLVVETPPPPVVETPPPPVVETPPPPAVETPPSLTSIPSTELEPASAASELFEHVPAEWSTESITVPMSKSSDDVLERHDRKTSKQRLEEQIKCPLRRGGVCISTAYSPRHRSDRPKQSTSSVSREEDSESD